MIRKLLVFLALSTISVSCLAANENTGTVKITMVQVWQGGAVYITTDGDPVNPASCSYTGSYFFLLDEVQAGKDTILSMLMAAKLANANTRLTILGTQCSSDRPVIAAVTLID